MTKVLFFGRLGDRFGREIEVDLPPAGCTVAELRTLLGGRDPSAGEALAQPCVKVCVDQAIVPDSAFVRPGQEIAFLPPLSGG